MLDSAASVISPCTQAWRPSWRYAGFNRVLASGVENLGDKVEMTGETVHIASPPGGGNADCEQFDRFLSERRTPLLRFLHGLKVSESDAQDLAQESLTRLIRYRHSEPASAWPALLYRIAINAVRDAARRTRVRAESETVDVQALLEGISSGLPSPEQYASSQQALAQLRSAILRLPPRCREIYLLHRIEGMSYPEIASHAGISVKGVEKHITRALRELRVTLDAQTGFPGTEG